MSLESGAGPWNLLIVEDDQRFRETLAQEFREKGYVVTEASSFKSLQAQPLLTEFHFAAVDLRLGRDSGLECVKWIHEHHEHCRIVVITGYASIATAVEAIRLGAKNYLPKPFTSSELETMLWTDHAHLDEREVEGDRGISLARHEREYIEFVLHQTDGNISQAAEWLGIHRQSLQRKLRKFTPRG